MRGRHKLKDDTKEPLTEDDIRFCKYVADHAPVPAMMDFIAGIAIQAVCDISAGINFDRYKKWQEHDMGIPFSRTQLLKYCDA